MEIKLTRINNPIGIPYLQVGLYNYLIYTFYQILEEYNQRGDSNSILIIILVTPLRFVAFKNLKNNLRVRYTTHALIVSHAYSCTLFIIRCVIMHTIVTQQLITLFRNYPSAKMIFTEQNEM